LIFGKIGEGFDVIKERAGLAKESMFADAGQRVRWLPGQGFAVEQTPGLLAGSVSLGASGAKGGGAGKPDDFWHKHVAGVKNAVGAVKDWISMQIILQVKQEQTQAVDLKLWRERHHLIKSTTEDLHKHVATSGE